MTIKEALKKFGNADVIRFHFLKHHYRDSFEFSAAALEASKDEFCLIESAAKAVPGVQSVRLTHIREVKVVRKSLSSFPMR